MSNIAIAISTYNRKESFFRCCHNMYLNFPENASIYIVDAGSDEQYAKADYAFHERTNISEVKNKCMQLCYDSGADHVFLFDDDSFPIKKGWHLPYTTSGEHHLCATFLPHFNTYEKVVTKDLSEGTIFCQAQWNVKLKEHRLANGYCLYFTRHCIEKVGGFDTNYNNKYEHIDLSRRTFNAGLTKHMFQDVLGSEELIYCLDKDNAIQRSFTNRQMQDNLKTGYEYFRSQEHSKRFIEFKT